MLYQSGYLSIDSYDKEMDASPPPFTSRVMRCDKAW